jgi:AAA domain
MAINLSTLRRGVSFDPPRILIYGVQGVGKSTFANEAPDPVFIQTEDGQGTLDLTSFPLSKSYGDVMEALTSLATEDHSFGTVVVDSLDWLEPLIWKKVAEDANLKSIEDIGYGKGYVAALDLWREYLAALDYLRNVKRMVIIQTAHAEIKRFDSPETEAYDRYNIKLHKSASALVQEHCDVVLFANYRVGTQQSDAGFGQKKTRAVGSGQRAIFTQEKPAFHAKTRFTMPDSIELVKGKAFSQFAQYVPFFQQQQQPQATKEN